MGQDNEICRSPVAWSLVRAAYQEVPASRFARLVSDTSPKYIDREGLGKRRKNKASRIMTGASAGKALLACSMRLDSGEQVKSYAANAKRNTRGKKLGETGAGARKRPKTFVTKGRSGTLDSNIPSYCSIMTPSVNTRSLAMPYFFPRQFFARALIFRPFPTILTPRTC